MNRRNFIKTSSLAGFTFVAGTLYTCSPATKKSYPLEIDSFELNEATIDGLQQKLTSGEYTSQQLTELYLKRIDAIDKHGPTLNSIIELNPDAIEIAKALDTERKNNKVRGPLHGIPILIKDNIDTADKMMTTAGALALKGNIASRDAFIVEKLRAAGAVLLGKTNLSEWANFRSTRSSSGWSGRGGQTRNPYALNRNPCGSSSGSGAAVAANLCTIAIGTETNGSVACPASINGIVGIKPTVGLWSRSGIIPISATQDTAGPMARTLRDAVILLGALAGPDPLDASTQKTTPLADYLPFIDPNGLKGKRIGVEKSFLKAHEGVDALFATAIETMKHQGATIVEVEMMTPLKEVGDAEYTVLKYEFKDGVNKYLSSSHAPVHSLSDVIAFNKKNDSLSMPYFKQEILESADALGGLDSKEYVDALNKMQSTTRSVIDGLMKKNSLDAICGPTDGPTWCTDVVNGDAFSGYGTYSPAAMAGYPSISIPMGNVLELPVGLCFIGAAFGEAELIRVASAYELASKKRVPPQFKEVV